MLLVEDESMIRLLVADALVRAGFDVHTCADGLSAAREFDAVDPDLLVTDIDLASRPNGVELAEILLDRAPHLAVMFLTNYPSFTVAPGAPSLPEGAVVLRKSTVDSVDEIAAAAERALAELGTPPTDDPVAAAISRLTPTQLEVLRMVAQGLSNAEIAARRGLTLSAAEKLVGRMLTVVGLVRNPSLNARVAAANLYTAAFGPVRADDRAGAGDGRPWR